MFPVIHSWPGKWLSTLEGEYCVICKTLLPLRGPSFQGNIPLVHKGYQVKSENKFKVYILRLYHFNVVKGDTTNIVHLNTENKWRKNVLFRKSNKCSNGTFWKTWKWQLLRSQRHPRDYYNSVNISLKGIFRT